MVNFLKMRQNRDDSGSGCGLTTKHWLLSVTLETTAVSPASCLMASLPRWRSWLVLRQSVTRCFPSYSRIREVCPSMMWSTFCPAKHESARMLYLKVVMELQYHNSAIFKRYRVFLHFPQPWLPLSGQELFRFAEHDLPQQLVLLFRVVRYNIRPIISTVDVYSVPCFLL